jgi:uncharacterized RDD family membrane protein YckC
VTAVDPDAGSAAAPSAGVWRRFMGAVYESVVLFGVVVFFAYGFSALLQFRGTPGPLRWAFQAFIFLVLAAYFVWFWSGGRRTLPMKTVSLRLVDRMGRPLSAARAAARYLWAWALLVAPVAGAASFGAVFLLLLPLPFAWALFDGQRRALYDVLAGTRLVVDDAAPPRPPS